MNDSSKQGAGKADPGLEALLSTQRRSGWRRHWRALAAFALVLLAGGGYLLFGSNGSSSVTRYVAEKAVRGTLVVKVTATGNLEPTNQVDVGSELSGTIAAVYVNDDDRVSKGQVLAVLDLSKFEDAVAEARAKVGVADAGLQEAKATVEEAKAKLARYREVSRLSGGKVPSKTEMDAAVAGMARAEAGIASARANITQAKATLRTAETNLGKAHIRSPISGVVLQRSVDPGQAVAASLQAVTLFKLAEDLSKMELKVDVDEADVGQVKAGQKASFTVDAWPNRSFDAVIARVGYNATDNGGVISYPAVLNVANDDLSLRPGMTATAQIVTVRRENALLVPNAALRFTPPTTTATQSSGGSVLGSLFRRPPRSPRKQTSAAVTNGTHRIWVLRNGEAVPLQVKTGVSNGRFTEILGGDLQSGMEVITETASAKP
jgi:HlyD family secretion protein